MKKAIVFLAMLLILSIVPIKSNMLYTLNFLDTADDVNDNTTAVQGVGFTTNEIDVSRWLSDVLLTIWFTPAVPAAVNITIEFSVTRDGTNWSTAGDYEIAIPTNTRAVGGVVRWSEPFDLSGVQKIRVERIIVGNGAGNCTEINAAISVGG